MSVRSRATIAGAGVFGLSAALAALDQGLDVLVVDPTPDGLNASSVAAGLLAPIGEAVFDPDAAAHHGLLVEALGLWPAFAARAGLTLSDAGLILPTESGPALARLGVSAAPQAGGLFVQADPRVVDPPRALGALRAAVLAGGGRIEPRAVASEDWRASDLVILAHGAGGVDDVAAPELSRLAPVKGQIAVLPHGPACGPTVRWPGGYLAPQPGGARVGATMEAGRRDTAVEPHVIAALITAAERHAPGLDRRGAYGQAGVRMQSPDALPLVGPSAAARTLLAVGARRNGWLLAPRVGRMIAAYCKGEDPGPWAARLHPSRFEQGGPDRG